MEGASGIAEFIGQHAHRPRILFHLALSAEFENACDFDGWRDEFDRLAVVLAHHDAHRVNRQFTDAAAAFVT